MILLSTLGSLDLVGPMLTFVLTANGNSFVWGVEQTCEYPSQSYLACYSTNNLVLPPDCTAYLLSLGLTKSKTSLVWIAGPLSGLIVQPIVGAIADESRSKWGRRRPYIVVGALLSAFFILVLGFTREIVDCFVSEEESARKITIWLAVLSIYCVDFTINAGMWYPYLGVIAHTNSLNCVQSCRQLVVLLSILCQSRSSRRGLLGVSLTPAKAQTAAC